MLLLLFRFPQSSRNKLLSEIREDLYQETPGSPRTTLRVTSTLHQDLSLLRHPKWKNITYQCPFSWGRCGHTPVKGTGYNHPILPSASFLCFPWENSKEWSYMCKHTHRVGWSQRANCYHKDGNFLFDLLRREWPLSGNSKKQCISSINQIQCSFRWLK